MADLLKRKFRGSQGFDAAGEKVINVATADRTVMSDGVNVEFLVQENTVQEYDPTRGYPIKFAVVYDNRIWTSNRVIASPAGPFNAAQWTPVRTDSKWTVVSGGTQDLKSGDFISLDTQKNTDITLTLPPAPQDGDTITIKDIGANTGKVKVVVNASVQSIVTRNGVAQVRSVQMTRPLTQFILVFNNRLWQLYASDYARYAKRATPAAVFEAQSNDFIVREFTQPGPVNITLPKWANDGDMINLTDLDSKNPEFHTIIKTFDNSTSIDRPGTRVVESRTSGDGFLTYDANEALWRIWEGDLRTRLRIVTDDLTMVPNESISVFGVNNTEVKTIAITLPTNTAIGDTVKIAMNYMRKGQTVNIIAQGTDKIASSVELLQFPKRSQYPPDTTWVMNQSLSFNGNTSYVPVLELSYIERDGLKYWIIAECITTVERVDSLNDSTRARVGVIALANQTQANVDKGSNPAKELAITPETLANRTATETRQGIARLATSAEMNIPTTAAHDDLTIVTPKKFSETFATETRRGVAEIATQDETNTGTDDTTIVTPKKFAARVASEILTGILKLVSTVSTAAGITRDAKGNNVYNWDNNSDAITPKSLNQYKATENAPGASYLASEAEVITGTQHSAAMPTVVTPVQLQKKTATEGRIGFTQIATQTETDAGTNDFKYITPLKFDKRRATQTLAGIAEIATQGEFDTGTDDVRFVTPLKIKTRFNSTDRTGVNALSGLTESGTIWDHYTLDIQEASETQRGTMKLATQVLVDAGVDDKTAVTPKKLMAKKASEGSEGIVQIATQPETVAGVVANKAVSPKNLKQVVQEEATWEATPGRRGFVKAAEGLISFIGNDTVGSTQLPSAYQANGFGVSPKGLNEALVNFLPKKATAVNSVLFNNMNDGQFIRRDINQTVNGELTLTTKTTVQAPLESTSTAKFTVVNATTSVDIGDTTGNSIIKMNALSNDWIIESAKSDAYLDFFANGSDVLRLNRNGNVVVAQTLSAGNRIDASKGFSVEGGTMVINPSVDKIDFGTQSKQTLLQTKEANTFSVTDTSGTYTVLNTKNAFNITAQGFVKKAGDSMTGPLTVNGIFTVQIPEGIVRPDFAPAANNSGTWTATINDAAIYAKLPGYAVPVMEVKDGVETKFVDHYDEVKGPGLLSQFGIGNNAVYQIWAPRPTTAIKDHRAQTFWIRNFNIVTNTWDGFGRMFTTTQPPTVNDIGAVSSSGSAFNNLTIRDWLQIGNVRITPNPVTRTVDFTWVD